MFVWEVEILQHLTAVINDTQWKRHGSTGSDSWVWRQIIRRGKLFGRAIYN